MYVTGTASSVADLITKIKDFCINSSPGYPGYDLEYFGAEGTGHKLHIKKSDMLFNFRSFVNENLPAGGATNATGIFMNATTEAYNPDETIWYDRFGVFKYNNGNNYVISGINKLTADIPAYHFFYFTDSDCDVIYIIVESPAGSYQRLMFGYIKAASTSSLWFGYPFGIFYAGSVAHTNTNYSMSLSFFGGADSLWQSGSPSGAVYGTFSNFNNGWASADFSIPQTQIGTPWPQIFDTSLKLGSVMMCSPNTFNSMPPLFPVNVFSTDFTTTGMTSTTPWYPVGSLPNIYFLNIFNLNPGAQITIGSDTYKVFPFRKKSDTWVSSNPDNGTYRFGFAIKTS